MYQLLERVEQIITQPFVLDATAQEILIHYADGDARRFLNATEQVIQASFFEEKTTIDADFVQNILAQYRRRFDKGGEQFYDQISALHKAVRGSHPDAALYWLCRMLDGGVDPLYLARRIVRMAWEDIGLADPRAIQIALDATATFERLGSPEGELALGEAVIYLALAAKSNAAYQAYQQAKNFVAKDQSQEVPLHLRNAPTQLMKNLDYGASYRYAHDEPHGYAAAESYLPLHMQEPGWYQPSDRGLEIQIKEKMAFLKKLDQCHKKDSNP
jgi:putative ATPase